MAVITMNVALSSIAGDARGISIAVKFAKVHRINAVNASMVVSEMSTVMLNFSFVRLLTASFFTLVYFSILSMPNLYRKRMGIIPKIL